MLAAQETDGSSPEGHRQLRAVARAELERLRRMLDSEGVGLEPSSGLSSVAVAPLMSDLAALHGATGTTIELDVSDDLQALVPPECLAHIVTNLLVNCARHAPGARVWLTARRRGTRGLGAQQLTPGELLARLTQPAPPGGLVLLDLDLGADVDGARLVGPVRRAGWRVLVITGTRDEPHIAAAGAAGAVGWVPKTAPFDELVEHAVRAAQGRSLLADAQRQRMREIAGDAKRTTEELTRRWQRLTPREREIIDCLVGGLRAGAIAAKFTVSVATVRTQIRSILAKHS